MRSLKAMLLASGLALTLVAPPVVAQTLRIAMTTSDVPTTGGIPDNGSEGGRFAGYPIYDALVNWDFTKVDAAADLTPGLATEWHVDPADSKRWIFTLRQGVKFHDGTPVTVESILWNLDRHLKQDAPNYDKAQAASYRTYSGQIAKYEKIDDSHLALTTIVPFSVFPYLVNRLFIVSPTQYEKVGNWQAFQMSPVGSGPFKVDKVTPKVSIELSRNDQYWDKGRIPKLKKLVLLPIPDANTRVAALRSGQVDWIEFPAPDSIPSLKSAGFNIVLKPYPHVWVWQYNDTADSVLVDKRLRQAINYGIDREGMVELLGQTAKPSIGFFDQTSKYFGKPQIKYGYDPEKAKALLKEAGYGPGKPLKLKVQLPTAGSGNMVPVPMGEFIQQNLHEINVDIEYEVVDWGTMIQSMRIPPGSPNVPHRDAIAHGLPLGDLTNFYNQFTSMVIPTGGNWSGYRSAKVDELTAKAFETFDPAQRDALIAQAHTVIVDEAAWLFVVHDLNPRALSPKVKGFVQAQSWYQDFTQVTVAD